MSRKANATGVGIGGRDRVFAMAILLRRGAE